jgi:two-component system, LytTR family, response regulator
MNFSTVPSLVQLPQQLVATPPVPRITILHGGHFVSIPIKEITHLEGYSNYTYLYTSNGKRYLMSKTLKTYEHSLDEAQFVRIHKSAIVNVNYLVEVSTNDDRFIKLKSGQVIPVSRRKVKDLKRFLLPLA